MTLDRLAYRLELAQRRYRLGSARPAVRTAAQLTRRVRVELRRRDRRIRG